MLAAVDDEVSKIKKDARTRGMREDRLHELVEERIKAADENEKTRPKRGAMDVSYEEGDEMELDGVLAADAKARSGQRMSKRLGLGRNG